jgi:tetrahydromethanopterin S-methyltransferase subunit B
MVSDLLFKEYVTYTEEEILAEIKDLYDDEVAQDLLESVDPHVPVASILKNTELLSGT